MYNGGKNSVKMKRVPRPAVLRKKAKRQSLKTGITVTSHDIRDKITRDFAGSNYISRGKVNL